MSSNADSLVRDAISAYRAGKKDEARNLLLQAVGIDERHEQGWLWLSAVVDTPEDQITCLENVLTINPNNEKAIQGIQLLTTQISGKPGAASSPQSEPDLEDEDPFANVSFTSPAPPSSPPALLPADDDDEELPDTSAWGTIETSSASAQRPKKELTPDDYNDWISGLNIGSNEAPEAFGLVEDEEDDDEPIFNASPFIGDDDEIAFELDRGVFGYDDDDDAGDKSGAGPFSANPFSVDDDDDDIPARPLPPPPAAPAPVALTSRPAAPSPRSPVAQEDDFGLDRFDEDDDFDDVFDDDNYDEANLGNMDPAEFFKFIPNEIKATRLPGTNERSPALVIISLLLLFVFNGGALALVWMTLTSSI